MATLSDSVSDAESDVLQPDLIENISLNPYQFEPEVSSNSECADSTDNESSTDEDDEERSGRIGKHDWCKCGKCHHELLVNHKEHICCLEIAKSANNAVHEDTNG